MRIAIVSSDKDPAGHAIHSVLAKIHSLQSLGIFLHLIDRELLQADNLEKTIPADHFIFASKHRSSSNTKSFAVHSIGNFADPNAGGMAGTLCPSPALLQREIFLSLQNRRREGYEVTMEATHHGPYTAVPSVFVEVGSTQEEWEDVENARIIAESILEGLSQYLIANTKHPNTDDPEKTDKNQNNRVKTAIGIGGPHYCNNFNKLVSRKNYAIGHICPKHHLDKLDEAMLRQAIKKTVGKVDAIILDWKGLGQEKARLLEILQSIGLPIERTDQILKERDF
ncbi:MAG TPA: D-aminoacyl-tRNA deacylase [Candidatus Nanoarchaeia archaeon]|nr:D-aminoacyl-tRNA deacylase [Candidatus Nanoarchaeia archaeon]